MSEDPLGAALNFCVSHAVAIEPRLFALALQEQSDALSRQGKAVADLYCLCVPRLIYAAVRSGEAVPQPLATALLLVHTGSELLDDLTDGDLSPAWQGVAASQIVLVAGAMSAPLAHLALAELAESPGLLAALHAEMATGLLAMIGGQSTDLAVSYHGASTAATVQAAIEGKCGGAIGLYARLAAILAGAPECEIASYAEFGQWLGVAAQLRSEYSDLFGGTQSRKLAAGSPTFPVAMHMERLAATDRSDFIALLHEARSSAIAQQSVRQQVRAAAIGRTCLLLLELQCNKALAALRTTTACEPARAALADLVQRLSLLGQVARRPATIASATVV